MVQLSLWNDQLNGQLLSSMGAGWCRSKHFDAGIDRKIMISLTAGKRVVSTMLVFWSSHFRGHVSDRDSWIILAQQMMDFPFFRS